MTIYDSVLKMYFNYKFKKECFICNLHADYYINKPNVPYPFCCLSVVFVPAPLSKEHRYVEKLYVTQLSFLH
jgi:hypothetical protein